MLWFVLETFIVAFNKQLQYQASKVWRFLQGNDHIWVTINVWWISIISDLFCRCGGWTRGSLWEWNTVHEPQNTLDLLIRDLHMKQRQLSRHFEPVTIIDLGVCTVQKLRVESKWTRADLGIRESLSTIHLASWRVKSIGCRMCWWEEPWRRAFFHFSPLTYTNHYISP